MDDVEHMRRAMALAATVRDRTAPNPWVGSVVVPAGRSRRGRQRCRRDPLRGCDRPPWWPPRRGDGPGRGR